MPDLDLDAELGRLRDGIRQSVPVPNFDRVLERSRQRVVRRRMQIGAAVAVLVVSVAVPLLRAGMAPDQVEPAGPPARTTEPTVPDHPFVYEGDFADREHGYALRAECSQDGACTVELLATGDGGEHWRSHPVPTPDGVPRRFLPRLYVLGEDEVVASWFLPGAVDAAERRLHSEDGGRTWQPVAMPRLVTDTVPAIPDGALLVQACAKTVTGEARCAEEGFAAVLPGTGASARLANSPPLWGATAGRFPTADGHWWAVGRTPGTRNWAMAVSEDDGRSWTTTPLDFEGAPARGGWSVISTGGTLYASASGVQASSVNGLLAIYRSDDRGRSWQQTWHWDDDAMPRETLGLPVALPDGSVMINAAGGKGRTFLSEDGARTFTEVERRYVGAAFRTRMGYLARPVDVPWDAFQISTDGEHWRDMTIG